MRGRRLVDLLILTLATVFISTHRHNGLRHQGDVGEIAGVSANDARKGRHLGFDTYAYPGDEVMRAWRHADVPYEWVGYYLPSAPCHKGTSWGGKRQTLAEIGWGVAVVYVGQQPWGDVSVPAAAAAAVKPPKAKPAAKKRAARRQPSRKGASTKTKQPTTCSRTFVTAARGALEADDAIAKTAGEGFRPGTVVFLNIERMNRVPQAMRDYYRAWTARMLANGRYRPGFYAHKFNAQIVYDDVKAEYERAGVTSEPPFWIAGGRGFSPERQPHEVGHAFAKVWQGVLDVVEEWKGFKLPIDVNVARVPSPSSHEHLDAD
jgi:hypothetical protein